MSDEGSSQSWDDTNCGHTERYQGVCLTCGHREDAGRDRTADEDAEMNVVSRPGDLDERGA